MENSLKNGWADLDHFGVVSGLLRMLSPFLTFSVYKKWQFNQKKPIFVLSGLIFDTFLVDLEDLGDSGSFGFDRLPIYLKNYFPQ